MTTIAPVLFVGGTGLVGGKAIQWFRQRHPELPLLVGGRKPEAAAGVARQVGGAMAVQLNVEQPRLGLPADTPIAAVAMFAPDYALQGLRLAQELGVPYLSISNGLVEVGLELGFYATRPTAAPIVLASHWAAGAALFLALEATQGFTQIKSLKLGVILDDQDPAGATSWEDIGQLQKASPAPLSFAGGRRTWLFDEEKRGQIEAIDGRNLEGEAFASMDLLSLLPVTEAREIRFDLTTAPSSSRLRGGPTAAEIIAFVEGLADGQPKRTKASLEFPLGQASLTGLSAVMCLEAVLGLETHSPKPAGLYLPELLLQPAAALDRLRQAGALIQIS